MIFKSAHPIAPASYQVTLALYANQRQCPALRSPPFDLRLIRVIMALLVDSLLTICTQCTRIGTDYNHKLQFLSHNSGD